MKMTEETNTSRDSPDAQQRSVNSRPNTGHADQKTDKIHRHFWRKCKTDFKETERSGDNKTEPVDGFQNGRFTFRERIHKWRENWENHGPWIIALDGRARIPIFVDGQIAEPTETPVQMPPGFGHRRHRFGRWRQTCGRGAKEPDGGAFYKEFDFIHG